jgi:hypothetical protein
VIVASWRNDQRAVARGAWGRGREDDGRQGEAHHRLRSAFFLSP